MEITLSLAGASYQVNLSDPHDLSIPVRFHAPQLSVFNAPPASSQPFQDGEFIGSVARGGRCNCDVHTLIPHTSGTHTECVGHIAESLIAIPDVLRSCLLPATLITLQPEEVRMIRETYTSALEPTDLLLTRASLEGALCDAPSEFLLALIIRTLPNPCEKQTRDYGATGAPFFSTEAVHYLVQRGIQHLLVDLPSVDRLQDGGKLSNHHAFWGVPQGSHKVDPPNASPKTITELIYASPFVADGQYLLNLQLAPFLADAAPSRPILYKVRSI